MIRAVQILALIMTTMVLGCYNPHPVGVRLESSKGFHQLRIEKDGHYFGVLELFDVDQSVGLTANDGRKFRVSMDDVSRVELREQEQLFVVAPNYEEFICIASSEVWDQLIDAVSGWSDNNKRKFLKQ